MPSFYCAWLSHWLGLLRARMRTRTRAVFRARARHWGWVRGSGRPETAPPPTGGGSPPATATIFPRYHGNAE